MTMAQCPYFPGAWCVYHLTDPSVCLRCPHYKKEEV